jgi:hypothetical protein
MNSNTFRAKLAHCNVNSWNRSKENAIKKCKALLLNKLSPEQKKKVNARYNKLQHKNGGGKHEPKQTVLYMMQMGQKYYKVGYTRRPIEKRIKSLQTGCNYQIQVVSTRRVIGNVTRKEAQLKQKFSDKFKQSSGGTEIFFIPNKEDAVKAFMQRK